MTQINWDEVDSEFAGGGPYVGEGKYDVKLSKVELKDLPNSQGAVWKFNFEDDADGKHYPTVDEWMSFKEKTKAGKSMAGWRQHHYKQILMMLGLTKDQAEKSIEKAESVGDKDKMEATYQQIFDKLADKKPAVSIEVYMEQGSDGRYYSRGAFTDSTVAMRRNTQSAPAAEAPAPAEDTIDVNGLPF